MALDYNLYICSPKTEEQIVHALMRAGNFDRHEKDLIARGLVATVSDVHPVTQELIYDEFRIKPSISVLFTVDKDLTPEIVNELVRILLTFLKEEAGDAIFTFSGEGPLLFRKGADFILNQNIADFWTADRLGEFFGEYKFEPLPALWTI